MRELAQKIIVSILNNPFGGETYDMVFWFLPESGKVYNEEDGKFYPNLSTVVQEFWVDNLVLKNEREEILSMHPFVQAAKDALKALRNGEENEVLRRIEAEPGIVVEDDILRTALEYYANLEYDLRNDSDYNELVVTDAGCVFPSHPISGVELSNWLGDDPVNRTQLVESQSVKNPASDLIIWLRNAYNEYITAVYGLLVKSLTEVSK